MRKTKAQKEAEASWLAALQAGASAHREKTNKNLDAGRVWTDERRAAWAEKAKTSWTPEKRKAAAERMAARHAAKKVLENEQHENTNATV